MAVVEYMMQLQDGKLVVPEYIKDRGHWKNSSNTYVGWLDDSREYYVPDSLIQLTKDEFKSRILALHQEEPIPSIPVEGDTEVTYMSNTDVTEMADSWYDEFVSRNSG